jgi:hypothetical protein
MTGLSTRQKHALEHPLRKAIYDFLQGYDKPASLGEIDEAVERNDVAQTHYFLNVLVQEELVETVETVFMTTTLYRVVER